MIHAGRRHLVRNLADLAKAEGVPLGTYKNKRLHKRAGHPQPISAPKARVLLYDAEQHTAYLHGDPIPDLSEQDLDDDLLDHSEAAGLLGLATRSWETYRKDPYLTRKMVEVKGVEHWPRRAVLHWDAQRPGSGHGGGRPAGTGDLIPREDLLPMAEELLEAQPDITADHVAEELGVHEDTAQRALATIRAARVRNLLVTGQLSDSATAADVSQLTGFHLRAARGALTTAQAQLRATTVTSYTNHVTAAVRAAGYPVTAESGAIVRPGGTVVVALTLSPPAVVGALIWDERYGWRTAPEPALPHGREDQPPTGPGIRYLTGELRPAPEDVVRLLRDRRTGARRPLI